MKRYLNHSWPSDDVLKLLVERFSRQFIYASTVAKYISSICYQPADRLNVVLGICPPRHVRELPFGELDALYTHIFTSVEHMETVLLILGVRLLSSSRIPQMNAEDLGDFFLLNRRYIEVLLGDLSAIITISDVDQFIHILHTSLGDFLLDAAHSKGVHVDLSSIHTACMHLCFQHNKQCMSTYSPSEEAVMYVYLIESASHDDRGRGHFIYAGENLLWHCENTPPSAYSQLREELLHFSLHPPIPALLLFA